MSRPITVQPEPLYQFSIEDTDFFVVDESTWPKGRGKPKELAFNIRADQMLEEVLEEYTKKDPSQPKESDRLVPAPRRLDKDYMASPSKFARRMETLGLVDPGVDDSSLRKSVYPHVKLALTVMFNAFEEKNKITPS